VEFDAAFVEAPEMLLLLLLLPHADSTTAAIAARIRKMVRWSRPFALGTPPRHLQDGAIDRILLPSPSRMHGAVAGLDGFRVGDV
jgi:hypothetical protein